jgi:hypothetical protein
MIRDPFELVPTVGPNDVHNHFYLGIVVPNVVNYVINLEDLKNRCCPIIAMKLGLVNCERFHGEFRRKNSSLF